MPPASTIRQHQPKRSETKTRFAPWQYQAIFNPYSHFAFFGGVASGKTYTGSHFAIHQMRSRPDVMGFIGANTYDQLSQVSLRELMYWLDEYQMDHIIDCRPPRSWGSTQSFKSHHNILSVKIAHGQIAQSYTRVLGDDAPLKGLEFGWSWIDETRDTPVETHDTLLARMRNSGIPKSLITTTTNGEDWAFNRFKSEAGSLDYGCMHIPTSLSLKYGIIDEDYYRVLRKTYSPQLAAQELDAKHVVVAGNPAYGSSYGPHNERTSSPFGFSRDALYSEYLPIVLGLDFNRKHMSWEIGQHKNREFYWFDEIYIPGPTTTAEAAREFVERFRALKIRAKPQVIVIGDAAGKSGNTKTAIVGESDYTILFQILRDAGITFSDQTPDSNPSIKDRVNTITSAMRTLDGTVSWWLHPQRCPKLKRDCENVTFKEGLSIALEKDKDPSLTHASDAAGYPVCVLAPLEVSGMVGTLKMVQR